MTPDDLSERLLNFAARVGKLIDALPDNRLGRHVAGQLGRCGTSPPANDEEARAAESRNDFVHKMSIVLKDLRESRGWLRLIVRSELLVADRLDRLLDEANQLCNIVAQPILTAKARGEQPAKPSETDGSI